MKKGTPFKIAVVGVVGIPVVILGLGLFGFVIKNPFPQNADITLTITDGKLAIAGESGNLGNCKQLKEMGCVRVSKWRRANIKFRLVELDDWAFSKMQLVAEASANAKLGFGSQTGFTEDMIKDFYVQINGNKVQPDNNGVIDLKELKKGEAFKLVDRNDFEQTYSYQIEACNDIQCEETDPMIENEGRR